MKVSMKVWEIVDALYQSCDPNPTKPAHRTKEEKEKTVEPVIINNESLHERRRERKNSQRKSERAAQFKESLILL